MSGITGIYALNQAGRFHLINLQRSMDLMLQRGRDKQGSFFDDRIGFGYRGGGIHEMTNSNQPFRDPGGNYSLVMDGEISNRQEIRNLLKGKNHLNIEQENDPALIILAYANWGKKCLEYLDGSFSLALHDHQHQKMILARDKIGIKPLYYYVDEDKILFASELRSILAYGIDKNLNINGLYQYLLFGYNPGKTTILNSVYKILPGQCLIIDPLSFQTEDYFNPDLLLKMTGNHEPTYQAYASLFHSAIEKSMTGEFTPAVCISEGIPAIQMAYKARQFNEHTMAFSIDLQGNSKNNSSGLYRSLTKKEGLKYTYFQYSTHELLNAFENFIQQIDNPTGNPRAILHGLISGSVGLDASLLLSSAGAFEIFGGGQRQAALQNLFYPFYPALGNWRRKYRVARQQWPEAYVKYNANIDSMLLLELFQEDTANKVDLTSLQGLFPDRFVTSPLKNTLQADLEESLPNNYLYFADMAAMAHNQMVRYPYLDIELVRFGLGLTEKDLLTQWNKPGHWQKLKRHVNPKLSYAFGMKPPFLNPDGILERLIDNNAVESFMDHSFLTDQVFFKPDQLKQILQPSHKRPKTYRTRFVWSLIVFQHWWKKYIQ